MLISVLTLAVATEMHVQVFGVYTSDYGSWWEAFVTTYSHLAAGQDLELTSGAALNLPCGAGDAPLELVNRM